MNEIGIIVLLSPQHIRHSQMNVYNDESFSLIKSFFHTNYLHCLI